MRWDRALVLVAAVGGATLCGGCLELELGVVLEADGSGTQRMKLGMTDRVVGGGEASARALDAGGTRADPLSVYDGKKVRAELAEAGLEVVEHRVFRERKREFVAVEAAFGAIGTLRKSPLFGDEGEWFLLAGRNPGGIRIVFYPRGHLAWLDAKQKARAVLAQPTAAQRQFFESQKKRVAGLDVGLRITLPGDVDYASPNLITSGKRTVTSQITENGLTSAAALIAALAPRYEIEFDKSPCVGTGWTRDAEDPGLVELAKQAAAARAAK